MKRKVVKQGNNTLTITLPRTWTAKFHVKAGDELEVEERERELRFSTDYKKQIRSISINVEDFGRLALAKTLMTCFEQGFDEITLNFEKQRMIPSWSHPEQNITDVINFFIGRLIGFEVLSQSPRSITIGNLSEKMIKFENILSRIFFLIEEYLSHLITAMKNQDKAEFEESENRHDNITKFISLALRIVYEDSNNTKTEALNYFCILSILDKITDFIRYAYRNNSQYGGKVSKETIEVAEKTLSYIEMYRQFYNKFQYKTISELDLLRADVKKRASMSKKEFSICSQFDAIAETASGMIKPRIALENDIHKLAR